MTRWHDINQVFNAMDMFRTQMNSLFTDFDRNYGGDRRWNDVVSYPRTTLSDTGEALVLIAEVPGMDKEKLNVKIQGNYLEISGARPTDNPVGYTLHRSERTAAKFSRSFTLPYEVDASRVTASMKDGLLTITLPKSEAAKPRQITIS